MANPSIDSLFTDCVFKRILNAQSPASSGAISPQAVSSAPIDVGEFEALAVLVVIGAIAASGVAAFKMQHGDLANGSDLADIEGSALTPMGQDDDNKMFLSEIIRPRKRYLNPVVTPSGGNVTVEAMIIIGYGKRGVRPVTQDATVKAAEQLGSPASGTA